jgi:DNA-binding MarR family transcriptional regulator
VDELAGPEETARQIWSAIAELFMSAENQHRFVGTADELGLSPPMLKALVELEPGESRPMRSLAEDWGFDASFVTVIVDGLEQGGYADRRVAEHDRRVKTVELTDKGVEAREWALGEVFGPRKGFWDLTPDERVTLAELLGKLAGAQAVHDRELLDSGRARGFKHAGQGHRGLRARAQQLAARARAQAAERGGPAGAGEGSEGSGPEPWRDHLAAHREELRRLRDELSRFRDEVRAQAAGGHGPDSPGQAGGADGDGGDGGDRVLGVVDEVVDELTAAAEQAEAVEAEVKAQLKGGARPPG